MGLGELLSRRATNLLLFTKDNIAIFHPPASSLQPLAISIDMYTYISIQCRMFNIHSLLYTLSTLYTTRTENEGVKGRRQTTLPLQALMDSTAYHPPSKGASASQLSPLSSLSARVIYRIYILEACRLVVVCRVPYSTVYWAFSSGESHQVKRLVTSAVQS